MLKFQVKQGYGKCILNLDGKEKTYNQGDVIEVEYKHQLGNILDKLIQLNPDEVVEGVKKGETQKKFAVKKRRSKKGEPARYDVVNVATGDNVNDDGLTKKEAEDLAGDMEGS